MPFYEYECLTCNHRFEAFQNITAPALTECESCNAPVRRIVFASAVVFKGSGFYATEYGNAKHNKSGKSEEAPAAASDSKSTTTEGKSSGGDTKSAGADSKSSGSESKSSGADSRPATSDGKSSSSKSDSSPTKSSAAASSTPS